MKYVAPSAPLAIGGVLDNWLRLFRSSFGACWAIALLAAVAGALAQLMITPPLPKPGTTVLQNYLQYWSALRGPTTFLTDIAYGFISLLVYGALLTQQTALIRGEEPLSVAGALGTGLRHIPQMLLGFVVIVLIAVAICIPAGIGAAMMITLRHSLPAALLGALAVIASVVVLIYVMIRLQLWLAAMFSEGLGGTSSLGRSWTLVKGQWWRVTGIGFVSGIVIWVVTVAIGAVIGVVTSVVSIHGTAPDRVLRRVQLIGAASQIVRLLTLPLLTAVWLAIYQDVKLRREGGDLVARAEALSGN